MEGKQSKSNLQYEGLVFKDERIVGGRKKWWRGRPRRTKEKKEWRRLIR